MSPIFHRRGKNWYSAIGILFIVSAAIVLIRQIILWSPGFVLDFILNSELTNEKVSMGMIAFGIFMILLGFRRQDSHPQ